MYKVWCGISTIAAVLRRKVYSVWEHILYPNLYVILVGPSGTRKSTAMRPAKEILSAVPGIKFVADATTREALIREIAQGAESDVDPKTGEVFIHCSITAFSSELTSFLSYKNIDLITNLCDWYDPFADSWRYDTKHEGKDHIIGMWVNILGATTPAMIQMSLAPEVIGTGLISRMVFVYETRLGKIIPNPLLVKPDEQLKQDLITDLERISLLLGEFNYTDDFMQARIAWYTAQVGRKVIEDPLFEGYVSKRATLTIKMSQILCASRTDEMLISAEDFRRALVILERTEENMEGTFIGYGSSPIAVVVPKVEESLRVRGKLTFRQILSDVYRFTDSHQLRLTLETLTDLGVCRRVREGDQFYYIYTKAPPQALAGPKVSPYSQDPSVSEESPPESEA